MAKHNPRVKAWQDGFRAGFEKKPYTPPNCRGAFGKLMIQSYLAGYNFAPRVLKYAQMQEERGSR